MLKKILLMAVVLCLLSGLGWFVWNKSRPATVPPSPHPSGPFPPPGPAGLQGLPFPPDGRQVPPSPPGPPTGRPHREPPRKTDLNDLKQKMLAQLKDDPTSRRTLELPPTENPVPEQTKPESTPSPEERARAQGRKERERLPMGVVLWDRVPVYAAETGSGKIYEANTGDVMRVISTGATRIQAHPGLDIYLAATTKKVEAAGTHLPDQAGWIDKTKLHVFKPEQAQEFLFELTPVTLGSDSSFSTLAFYERAMKNPDPVVHRMVGPRLISVVTRHKDYAASWFSLYRDHDPKIRATTLAALRERGVAGSRAVIEDLIKRLVELTRVRAQGETEVEALAVLDILKASRHPRVPAALASFVETWKGEQGPKLNEALNDMVSSAP